MPKILIKEYDETIASSAAQSNEVVYIPGCVDTSQSCLFNNGTYVGLETNVPTLYTSVAKFEADCGTKPLTFARDWDYRELTCEKTNVLLDEKYTTTAFDEDAIPYHSIMFKAGDFDPAYIMAKELLSAGLSVMYERINKGPEPTEIDVTTIKNWKDTYTDYLVDMNGFAYVQDKTPPAIDKTRTFIDAVTGIVTSEDKKTTTKVENVLFPKELVKSSEVFVKIENGTNYESTTRYYTKENDVYKQITDMAHYISNDKIQSETDIYKSIVSYTPDVDMDKVAIIKGVEYVLANSVIFTPVTETPKDWATTYFNYIEYQDNVDTTIFSKVPVLTADANTWSTKFYTLTEGIQLDDIYAALNGVYTGEHDEDTGYTSGLADKGNYSIKYITSGGYPVFEYADNAIVNKMLNLAATRGDCYALIDHTDQLGRTTDVNKSSSIFNSLKSSSIFNSLKSSSISNGEYGAMFTPWATYNRTTSDKDGNELLTVSSIRMPASFAYLTSLANSIKTNATWLAVAGATRGTVKNLATGGMTTIISNGVADAMQPRKEGVSINAITNIRPYGQTIWGNRTLKYNAEGLTATSFLNIRNLICDVKKVAYSAAKALTFEQDNEVLWINFKSKIAPTLDKMLSGYGLSGYKIVRDYDRAEATEKATVCAKIILYPAYAVEDFYIDIILREDETTVESE